MQNARLPDGSIINPKEYIPGIHDGNLRCPYCGAKVIFVSTNTTREPFFKTTGKSTESKHLDNCPQKRNVEVFNSIKQIRNYHPDPTRPSTGQHVLHLELGDLYHERKANTSIPEIGWDHPKKQLDYANQYPDKKHELPDRARTLKALARYIKNSEAVLASTIVKFNGAFYPISEIVIDQNMAHDIALTGNELERFIYGTVFSVVRLEKVMYINFDQQDGALPFTIVVFQKSFKKFTYTKEKLEGKNVLVRGIIRFNSRTNQTETTVWSNSQLEWVK